MLIALVARAPVFGAKVKSFDAAKAKAYQVVDVVQVPSGVAVIGKHFWGQTGPRARLRLGPRARCGIVTAGLVEDYRKLAQRPARLPRKPAT